MRRRARRLALAGLAALLLVAAGWLPAGFAAPVSAVPGPDSLQVTVVSVTPNSPTAGSRARKITISLQLTNVSARAFAHLTVIGVRGNPVDNQKALNAVLETVQTPDPGQAAEIRTKHPVTAALGPGDSTVLDYVSTTSTAPAAGLCLCQNRIYPLYFAVHATLADGSDAVVGTAQTFVPSFGGSLPEPVQVSWVWPLLEQPHRTTSYDEFTDDELADSVAGGRLDHLLQTLELIVAKDPTVPLTLLVDPDLIDELAVMATGPYTVQAADATAVPGTGGPAAQSWLQALRDVLTADPNLQLAFTPYADPDVRSLTAHGLDWAQELTPSAQQRVTAAIGGYPVDTDVSWPSGGSLDEQTLTALVRSGVHTVIVNDATLPAGARRSPPPNALAPMPTAAGKAKLAVTSSPIEHYAQSVVSAGGPGLSMLPQLVAELAIRAEEQGSRSHYVVITAPRDVDPDPVAASQAVLATTRTDWSEPMSLSQAVEQVTPVRQGRLHPQRRLDGLPSATVDAAKYLATALPTMTSLVTDPRHPTVEGGASPSPSDTASPSETVSPSGSGSASASPSGGASPSTATGSAGAGGPPGTGAVDVAKLIVGSPIALQRAESSEWSGTPSGSAALATSLRHRVAGILAGVHLIRPTQGTYTLGSEDSPLPITIDNTLDVKVWVQLRVSAVGGLPGFHPGDLGVLQIAPQTKQPVHVPVHVDRVGRIRVQVELATRAHQHLGTSLQLSVRSTALGQIGKIITFVAGAVLAAALLLRLLRQWYRHRRRAARRAADPPVRSHA